MMYTYNDDEEHVTIIAIEPAAPQYVINLDGNLLYFDGCEGPLIVEANTHG